MSEDADPRAAFVESFALVLTEAGMPRMPARVFACALADDDGRLTAAQLAARLRVSPAAISGAVRYCVNTDLLIRGRAPGDRVDHYRLADGLWYEVFTRRETSLVRWEAVLAEGARDVGPDSPAGRRLAESRDFFAFMRAELPALMERWRASRGA